MASEEIKKTEEEIQETEESLQETEESLEETEEEQVSSTPKVFSYVPQKPYEQAELILIKLYEKLRKEMEEKIANGEPLEDEKKEPYDEEYLNQLYDQIAENLKKQRQISFLNSFLRAQQRFPKRKGLLNISAWTFTRNLPAAFWDKDEYYHTLTEETERSRNCILLSTKCVWR